MRVEGLGLRVGKPTLLSSSPKPRANTSASLQPTSEMTRVQEECSVATRVNRVEVSRVQKVRVGSGRRLRSPKSPKARKALQPYTVTPKTLIPYNPKPRKKTQKTPETP